MKMLLLFSLITLISFGANGQVAEIFSQGDDKKLEFFIVGKRVSWSRAKVLCSSYANELNETSTSKLASLEDEVTRKWLARMLSESDNSYDELWIDGKRESPTSEWTWMENNLTIESSPLLESYAIWHKGRQGLLNNCLTFGRIGHDMPALVPSDCQQRKPFICTRAAGQEKDKIVERSSVFVDGYNYTLYGISRKLVDDTKFVLTGVGKLNGGGVKWRDARIECRKRGQHLAMILSNDAAVKIANEMLRSRPSVENAWIGGWSEDGISWIWSGIGQDLPSKKSEATNYPPWLTNHPRVSTSLDRFSRQKPSCLMLDRHLCPENVNPVFLDIDCEKKRPFICQHDVPESEFGDDTVRSINQADSSLEFSVDQMTWKEGDEFCKKKQGRIANIFDGETLFTVLDKMTELYLEHVWIDGKTVLTSENDVWVWMDGDGRELPKKGLNGPISWCLGIDQNSFFKPENNSCLNLDREAHGAPLFYGLPCDSIRQQVICRIPRSNVSQSVINNSGDKEGKFTESARKSLSTNETPVKLLVDRNSTFESGESGENLQEKEISQIQRRVKVSDLDTDTQKLLFASGYNLTENDYILGLEVELVDLNNITNRFL